MIRFTPDHEWLDDTDGDIAMGLTPYAAASLGTISYVELPQIGAEVEAGDELVIVESDSDGVEVCSPVDGVVVAVNKEAAADPASINEDPLGTWLVRISADDEDPLESYLDEAAYKRLTS